MRYFNDNYLVDEYGALYSIFRGKLKKLKPYRNHNGYLMYRVRENGKTKAYSSHHLSYYVNVERFSSKDGLQIDHIDGNKDNNHFSNLRRVTPKENANNINTCKLSVSGRSRCTDKVYPTDLLPKAFYPTKKFSKEDLSPVKTVSKEHIKRYGYNRNKNCVVCNEPTGGKLCLKCYNEIKASNIPSKDTLVSELLSGRSLLQLAKLYGISDNAYRKWLKKHDLPTKRNSIKEFIRAYRQVV